MKATVKGELINMTPEIGTNTERVLYPLSCENSWIARRELMDWVYVTGVLHTARISTGEVTIEIHHLFWLITTHDDFDSANPSSMQDACHIWTQLKWLCSQWVLVAQWIERSPVLREVMGSIPVVPGHARVMLINSPFILKNNFTNIYRPPTS